ncbi:restriction endonuclease subunit S [Streptomyces sp. NPDC127037]|uniref:restriction endonuclease subunit S n=1 Tax=Streptomyces sp. NPDC127037 TaxID=3347113 RepID=UPI00365E08C9
MSEWQETNLAKVVGLKRGIDLPTPQRRPGPYPVLGSSGITGWHDEAPFCGPGVTIGRSGASIGTATWHDGPFWPLNTTLYVEDFKGNDPQFIFRLLDGIDFNSYNSGSAQPSLNRNFIAQIGVSLPGVLEQKAIAGVLKTLDDKIAVNERIAATADTLASVHYQSERVGLPAESERLGRLADVVVGGTPSRSKPEYWSGGTINWINSGKANEFRVLEPSEMITEDGLSASSVKLMPPGATLIGITGATMGQISRLEIVAGGSQNIAGVWSDDPALNDWLFYDIKARVADLTKHASGGAQQHINKRIIVELECVVPNAARLAAWSAKTSPLLRIAAHALVETRTLATLRDTLLPQLMSGRLRVQDAEKIVEDRT